MGVRGKQSAASLSVVKGTPGKRPDPPAELNAEQAQVWRDVVATKPVDWWDADSFPLLSAYCKAIILYRGISTQVENFNMEWLVDEDGVKRLDKLTIMQERQARLMSALATRMRLTQQSRYKAETANTASKKAGGATKPWEFGSKE